MESTVQVELLNGFGKPLTYSVPEKWRNQISVGCLVQVPLQNRTVSGIVTSLNPTGYKGKTRCILDLMGSQPILSDELLQLALWIAQRYGSSLGAVLEGMVPVAVRRVVKSRSSVRSLKLKAEKAELAAAEQQQQTSAHFELTSAQKNAILGIQRQLAKESFGVALLHGVTSSGKTEVYLRAMESVLTAGENVLYLVPQMSLTPASVARIQNFLDRLPEQPHLGLWHGRLTPEERRRTWQDLKENRIRVLVGTRSAVLMPLPNLGLVVIDEEQDASYKQEESVRYDAREVALERARISNVVAILGSATPSLESLHSVEEGRAECYRLPERVGESSLPKLFLVDLNQESRYSQTISELLKLKIAKRLERKEQTLLFINRRGFAQSVVCSACGYMPKCPSCGVPLVWHKAEKSYRCHFCNVVVPEMERCPKCHRRSLQGRGRGTEKVEQFISMLFPEAKWVRTDSDTVSHPTELRTILKDFHAGKYDILIGTQMIAKGLDFPNVTLVGILDADLALYRQDFRSAEHTFQMLTQVAGRAGRRGQLGEVVIQTHQPDNIAIQMALKGNDAEFYHQELSARKLFGYPPYRHLVRQIFMAKSVEDFQPMLQQWVPLMVAWARENHVEMRGPVEPAMSRIKGWHRLHIWYFAEDLEQFLTGIQPFREALGKNFSEIREIFDVHPQNLS